MLRDRVSNIGQHELCGSCRHSLIIKNSVGTNYFCLPGSNPIKLAAPATECNNYESANLATKYEMVDLAWVLEIKKGKIIGFNPPKLKED